MTASSLLKIPFPPTLVLQMAAKSMRDRCNRDTEEWLLALMTGDKAGDVFDACKRRPTRDGLQEMVEVEAWCSLQSGVERWDWLWRCIRPWIGRGPHKRRESFMACLCQGACGFLFPCPRVWARLLSLCYNRLSRCYNRVLQQRDSLFRDRAPSPRKLAP